MAAVTSHILYNSSCDRNNGQVRIDAAYDPTGGCKGGLNFVKIIPSGTTGVYFVQLKNIEIVKFGGIDLTDGDFTFDVDRVIYVNAEVISTNPPTLTTDAINTAVQIDPSNNRIIVYVYDNTGAINVPASSRLMVSVIFTKFFGRSFQ